MLPFVHLDIREGDIVLDIGSGSRPHPRSNVSADRYLADDSEREGPLLIDRPFVVCDICALPFADKSFDYVIAGHILEHIEDVPSALAELSRVAYRGYIECPSPLMELLFEQTFHRWYVDVDGDCLIFTRKPIDQVSVARRVLPEIMHKLYACSLELRLFVEHNYRLFYVTFEWQAPIRYKIQQLDGNLQIFSKYTNPGIEIFDLDTAGITAKMTNLRRAILAFIAPDVRRTLRTVVNKLWKVLPLCR